MSFELLSYSHQCLFECLLDESQYTSANSISTRRHFNYFQQYFEELKAKTILIENEYVDRDYLHDHVEYYARCFWDYPRRTRRLHFFSDEISIDDFERELLTTPVAGVSSRLQADYLGFIVVRPLPLTIIGRTCLRTYSTEDGRRNFPSLRIYPVNLYGIELEVKSLAYQEQDQVVAACATSALWTCLQGTGKLFQHPIPAPVEITRWASDQMPDNPLIVGVRTFPNTGLTATQMAQAIRRVELEPHIIRAGTKYDLHSAAYAYLRGRIPSILSVQLTNYKDDQQIAAGAHAVAITGYSLRDDAEYEFSQAGFRLRAAKIDKLYVHDDQTGPFCRLEWSQLPMPEMVGKEQQLYALKNSWSDTVYQHPDFLLLPLYHKIRIPFSLIHDEMLILNALLSAWREVYGYVEIPEWDIYLTTVNDYKSSVRQEYAGLGVDFRSSLYTRMPRFLWRVTLRAQGVIQMDFLFDATGLAQNSLLIHSFSTECESREILSIMAMPEYEKERLELPVQVRAIIESFGSEGVSL